MNKERVIVGLEKVDVEENVWVTVYRLACVVLAHVLLFL